MVAEAAHAQVGHTDADLKRLKYAVTNLKGGVQELDGHARFLQGTAGAPLPRRPVSGACAALCG